jgi:hypothetical protein
VSKTTTVRVTRTTVVTYDVTDGDGGYYAEHDVVNVDMAALKDLDDLRDGTISIEDLNGEGGEDTWEIVIVEDNDEEREPDITNTERDEEHFPKDDDEEEEAPVAGELNAGGEAYGNS